MNEEIKLCGKLDPHPRHYWTTASGGPYACGPKTPMNTHSVLMEAEDLINGQRHIDYGGELDSFSRIAVLWSAVLETKVTAEQVALCMIQLKVSRAVANLANGPVQRDSLVDIAGYAGCLEHVQSQRAARGEHEPES